MGHPSWTKTVVGDQDQPTALTVATDEHGKPNIGPYPCGGIVIINAHTQEVIRSGQYWALAHFSRFMKRGAAGLRVKVTRLASATLRSRTRGGSRCSCSPTPETREQLKSTRE